MPNDDDQRQPTIKEQREELDNELTEYDNNATTRYGNTQAEINEGRMTKEDADVDSRLVEKGRQKIRDRRKELGPDLEVGDKEAKYASKNFNENPKPKSVGAAVPEELDRQSEGKIPQPQSREELMRHYKEAAQSQDYSDNEKENELDHSNAKEKGKDEKAIEK